MRSDWRGAGDVSECCSPAVPSCASSSCAQLFFFQPSLQIMRHSPLSTEGRVNISHCSSSVGDDAVRVARDGVRKRVVEGWEKIKREICPWRTPVLIMFQIHLPGVQVDQRCCRKPTKKIPQTRIRIPPDPELCSKWVWDFCQRENPSTPYLTFSIRTGTKINKHSFMTPFWMKLQTKDVGTLCNDHAEPWGDETSYITDVGYKSRCVDTVWETVILM